MSKMQNNFRQILISNASNQLINRFKDYHFSERGRESETFVVLCSKMLCTNEQMTEEELVLLFTARENMLRKMETNISYKRKYLEILRITKHFFVNIEGFVSSDHRTQAVEYFKTVTSNCKFLLNARNYYGNQQSFRIQTQISGKVYVKPKNRIGVGYRDKGNAKNLALDGSQSWEEVASDMSFQDRHSNYQSVEKKELLYRAVITGRSSIPWFETKRSSLVSKLTLRVGEGTARFKKIKRKKQTYERSSDLIFD